MAFIKLYPPKAGQAHPTSDVIFRLRNEFRIVDTNPHDGRAHVAAMIAATLPFSDSLPHKQAQLTRLREIQDAAVYVRFGDSDDLTASCCLLPDTELFFASPEAINGLARPLVERCARVLGYELFEG